MACDFVTLQTRRDFPATLRLFGAIFFAATLRLCRDFLGPRESIRTGRGASRRGAAEPSPARPDPGPSSPRGPLPRGPLPRIGAEPERALHGRGAGPAIGARTERIGAGNKKSPARGRAGHLFFCNSEPIQKPGEENGDGD